MLFFGHDLDVYLTVLRAESLLHTWNMETLCVFCVFATPVSVPSIGGMISLLGIPGCLCESQTVPAGLHQRGSELLSSDSRRGFRCLIRASDTHNFAACHLEFVGFSFLFAAFGDFCLDR